MNGQFPGLDKAYRIVRECGVEKQGTHSLVSEKEECKTRADETEVLREKEDEEREHEQGL